MPRKIRELIHDLRRAGFVMVKGGKGSHYKLRHPNHPGSVRVSGREGDDARHYQEAQVKDAIRKTIR
ncbi:MAG: type II toxin-antitoxin system HicA family toxin [Verrucomicrobia bacterium]|nr:type II toxin-antitoxin system HicA family toxin [Verrucomicrobiota bacterium]